MKLLGISGTITGSKTLVVVKKVLERVKEFHPDVETELLDLKQFNVQFCGGRDPASYEGDTRKVIDAVTNADFYLIGTPIFQGSLTGALKNLIDLTPVTTFRNKVFGFAATAGTYQHYLVIENQLKPIVGYFRGYVAPRYVYAHNDHFDPNNVIIDEEILSRIDLLAKELVFMHKALTQ